MKKRLLSFATAVSLVTLALAFASPVAHAAPPPCRVKDAQTGILFTTVQGAQDVATPGDKLVVKGTCIENVTFDRDLLVVGKTASGYGIPTIDGNATGSSVTVNAGVTFTIKALTITGGSGTYTDLGGTTFLAYFGGGIFNDGTLTLKSVVVTGNVATGTGFDNGGGIFNDGGRGATLSLTESSVKNNTSDFAGGGITDYPTSGSTISLNYSSVNNNTAEFGGGMVLWEDTATLKYSSVSNNMASLDGGGIYGSASSTTLVDSTINGNQAVYGGGVFADSMTLAMKNGSTITRNTATLGLGGGGGINDFGGNTFNGVIGGVNVFGNNPDDIAL